jgi:hypothetical protein
MASARVVSSVSVIPTRNDAASPLRHEQLGVTPPLRSNVA